MRRVRPSDCSSVCPSEHSSGCRGTFVEIYARARVSLARPASRYGEVRFEHNDRSVVCVCVSTHTNFYTVYPYTQVEQQLTLFSENKMNGQKPFIRSTSQIDTRLVASRRDEK